MKTSYLITLCMALAVGVALITELANVQGKTNEKVKIADPWLVKGHQIKVETINKQVMLRRRVNVEAIRPMGEYIANGLDGGKGVRNDPEGVSLSAREVVESSQIPMEFDGKSQADQVRRLHADRVKLIIIYSLALRSMSPLGHT